MRTLLSIFTLLCCAVTFAQSTVTGKVMDNNGQPIPGVNVVVDGTATGAVTDFDGLFTLQTDKTPPFTLRFTSVGFEAQTAQITSNNQNVEVTMQEEATLLDEIVISASRTPERIRESPVTIERFDVKAIQNSSAPTFYDSLENLKGVDMNTNSLTFKSINTRGFASFANTRFVQLVDGMDNSSPALNFPLGNLLGMSELDVNSVELLPGASSALYGANAFNGILFMTSKSPFTHTGISTYLKTGLTSSDNAGDNAFYDVGVRAAHKFSEKFAAKASVSYLQGTEWFSTDFTDFNNPGFTRDNPNYDGLNIYGDEVATTLDFDEIAAGALPIPAATNYGSATISRTGYAEQDLMNYDAESVKADFALHYKPFGDDLEFIWNSKIGRGNTIYQGANRYSIQDFFMQQHKLEVRSDNFFVRGYTTSEKAGNSYDTRFTAINVNRRWKSDQQWFTDYAGAFIGALAGQGIFSNPTEDQLAAAHAAGRSAADTGRFLPGTPEFENAFNAVTADGDLTTGSRFQDNSRLYHVDANYNFAHLTKDFADIMIGGSYRQFELNSAGTIYTDTDGPINYSEYGAYLQVQKKFADERVKFTGSVRYDKSEFFDGFFSPRASLVVALDEEARHNIRASFQTGFRNPDTQSLFIGLNAGRAILVGSAPDNLDRYSITLDDVSTNGQAIIGNEVTLTGRQAYENSFDAASVRAGAPVAAETPLVEPEQVTAYEVGYRGILGSNFNIDLSVYYNTYDDFLSNRNVLVPYYGTVGDNSLSLLALQNEDFQVFQTYTNAVSDISSYGGAIGINTKVLNGFDLGLNYTYAKLDFDRAPQDADFETNFNTPEHKVKASFGKDNLFENFGFNVNWRWNDAFLWESTFADGIIPARNLIDAQINLTVPSIKSIFKIGGANILGHEYVSAPGAGTIGAQYFVSWTINQ